MSWKGMAGCPTFDAPPLVRLRWESARSRLRRFRFFVCSSSSRPLRLNLNHPYLAERVVPEAAPGPILRFFAQLPFNRVAMNVTELFREVGVAANIAVIIALLPEMSAADLLGGILPLLGRRQFQPMYRIGQRARTGLAEEQMNMLRHNHVSVHAQRKLLAVLFKSFQEQGAYRGDIQPRLPSIATECDEMSLPRVLQSYQPLRHAYHFTGRV